MSEDVDKEIIRWLLLKTKTQVQNVKKDLCDILIDGIVNKDNIFATVKLFDELGENLNRSIELVQNPRIKDKNEHTYINKPSLQHK